VKPFSVFLAEGGNVDLGGGLEADKIDMTRLNRKDLVLSIVRALRLFSKDFKAATNMRLFGYKVWTSGSTEALFNLKGITDADFVKHKPLVGDIDVQVDANLQTFLTPFLGVARGKTYGDGKLLGSKQSAGTSVTLWDFPKYKTRIQIDFEYVDFAQGRPTAWAKLSHSSSWTDMQQGVKGVFHKNIIQAIDARNLREVYLMSPKGKSMKKTKITNIAFSVVRGVRFKYEPVLDDKGNHMQKDGLFVYKEQSTSQSNYVTDINEMFKILFGFYPTGADLEAFNSFTGIAELIHKNFKRDEKQMILFGFVHSLWDTKRAQRMYRGDPNRDLAEKSTAYNILQNLWKVDPGVDVEKMKKAYYQAY
jgi:hypothetical protein